MKAVYMENDAGDSVIVNHPSSTSKAYEEAGYKVSEDSETKIAAANTFATIDTSPEMPLNDPDESVWYKDDQDVPADPSAVAYPAGQLPRETVAGGPTMELGGENSESTIQSAEATTAAAVSGTVPLTEAYSEPPTPGRNPSPEAREAQRLENEANDIVDPRGVHPHVEGESTAGAPVEDPTLVPMPADLQPENVAVDAQGANKGETSQGTERPAAKTTVTSRAKK